MREPTINFVSLIEILNLKSKRELVRHCKNITIYQQDFIALILAVQHGELAPYKYANHFARTVTENLFPNESEQAAISENKAGEFRTKQARKFANKIFQLFREQRALAAHLFYTADHNYWHLFYFDNRDKSEENNHWKHGPHIHYVSDLWPELPMVFAWDQVTSGTISFPNKLHIRYKER